MHFSATNSDAYQYESTINTTRINTQEIGF